MGGRWRTTSGTFTPWRSWDRGPHRPPRKAQYMASSRSPRLDRLRWGGLDQDVAEWAEASRLHAERTHPIRTWAWRLPGGTRRLGLCRRGGYSAAAARPAATRSLAWIHS